MSLSAALKFIGCTTLAFGFLAYGRGPAAHPDFSGTWKLNPELSSFAPLPPLRSLIDRVEQSPSVLKIHQVEANTQRQRTIDMEFHIDGVAVTAKHNSGESKTLARWEGRALVIESSVDFFGLPMHVRDRWTMGREGRLEIARQFNNQQGIIRQKLILERQ